MRGDRYPLIPSRTLIRGAIIMKRSGLLKSNRRSKKVSLSREATSCPKCQGMRVAEWVFTDEGEVAMVRCIRCGDLVDSVVLFNRNDSRTLPSDNGRKKSRKLSPSPAKILAA
jgi:Zn ribbon nucleic-acid-binding protein